MKTLVLVRTASCSCITAAHISFQVIGAPGLVDVLVNMLCKISSGLVANLLLVSEIIISVKSFSPRRRPQPGQFELDWK